MTLSILRFPDGALIGKQGHLAMCRHFGPVKCNNGGCTERMVHDVANYLVYQGGASCSR